MSNIIESNKLFSFELNLSIPAATLQTDQMFIELFGKYFYIRSVIWQVLLWDNAAHKRYYAESDPNINSGLVLYNPIDNSVGSLNYPVRFQTPADMGQNGGTIQMSRPGQFFFNHFRVREQIGITTQISNYTAVTLGCNIDVVIEIQESDNIDPV